MNNLKLKTWIEEITDLCLPAQVHICDGSLEEFQSLADLLVQKGTFTPLKRAGSFWCHSTPDDVARLEQATFICSSLQENAGPTNHWKDPHEMKNSLFSLFRGCMQGRTLYVVPFCLGPLGSSHSRFGVEFTDSPYVVCNLRIMTQMGKEVLSKMGDGLFVPCLHSVGSPLLEGVSDTPWPTNPQKYIVHFPDEPSVWSFGSGYGGNALLSKKSFALRIASVMGKKEGWLAEHMLILGITNPEGEKKYFAAAFPSACGKTNLALLKSSLPGWTIECIGDDIGWFHFGEDGRLYGINPEKGFFGVAPGTSEKSNPHAMATMAKNTIFTNTALTEEGDVWWEGLSSPPPEKLTDWQGNPWTPNSSSPASHPNARFTAPIEQCPILDAHYADLNGVPISGIIFGGRRSDLVPLVLESLSWEHGVFLGASLSSETTAAAIGDLGKMRQDPFAMLPFCGYHMGDYFAHWLEMGQKSTSSKLPKIFHVNWFRKAEDGSFLWPGYGENIRVLKWCFERIDEKVDAEKTAVGYLPKEGLFPQEITHVDPKKYQAEVKRLKDYFSQFGEKFPEALRREIERLEQELSLT